MVANKTPYNPAKVGINEQTLIERRIARYKRELERITGEKLEISKVRVP